MDECHGRGGHRKGSRADGGGSLRPVGRPPNINSQKQGSLARPHRHTGQKMREETANDQKSCCCCCCCYPSHRLSELREGGREGGRDRKRSYVCAVCLSLGYLTASEMKQSFWLSLPLMVCEVGRPSSAVLLSRLPPSLPSSLSPLIPLPR